MGIAAASSRATPWIRLRALPVATPLSKHESLGELRVQHMSRTVMQLVALTESFTEGPGAVPTRRCDLKSPSNMDGPPH